VSSPSGTGQFTPAPNGSMTEASPSVRDTSPMQNMPVSLVSEVCQARVHALPIRAINQNASDGHLEVDSPELSATLLEQQNFPNVPTPLQSSGLDKAQGNPEPNLRAWMQKTWLRRHRFTFDVSTAAF
jgi:hypothetical protein